MTEPFSRDKVLVGVRKACQGRPVGDGDLKALAQSVEDAVRGLGTPEVASQEVGLAILGPLRELDEVAYLRFASVYQGFESLADFEAAIAVLRAERDQTVPEPAPHQTVPEPAPHQTVPEPAHRAQRAGARTT